jgi:ethanolamine transporter EutH
MDIIFQVSEYVGIIAFAVSGAWVVAGHLAFTIAFPGGEAFVLPMVLGKLSAALFALLLAALLSGRILAPKKSEISTQNTVTE